MTTTSSIPIAGLEGGRVDLTSEQLDELDSRVEGPLLRRGRRGLGRRGLIWNGMVASGPRARRPADCRPHDVAAAVRFARDAQAAAQHQGRRPQHRRHRRSPRAA